MPSYEWEWEGYTDRSYDTSARSLGQPSDPFPFDDIVSTAKYTAITAATEAFVKEFADRGINVTVQTVTPFVELTRESSCRQFRDWTECTWRHYLRIRAIVKFESDTSLADSPLGGLATAALAKIAQTIIWALIAAFAIYLLTSWLESMTTKKSVIKTIKYDPDTGEIIEETETIIEEPAVSGILAIGLLALLGLMAVGEIRRGD